jgi:hypothetical protein
MTGRIKQVGKIAGILTILSVLAAAVIAAYLWLSDEQNHGEYELEDNSGFESGEEIDVGTSDG